MQQKLLFRADKVNVQPRPGTSKQDQYGWRVLVICPDPAVGDSVSSALSDTGLRSVLRLSEIPEPFGIKAVLAGINLCFIEVSSMPSRSFALIERIAAEGVSVIALHRNADVELQLECLRRGVSEFVNLPLGTARLQSTLDRISARRQYDLRPLRRSGSIFAVMPGKGGSGSTTVATQLALCLSKVPSNRTLLVDIDGVAGGVGLALKLKPAFSLLDCVADLDRLDQELWNTLLTHVGPLDVLPAPAAPTPLDMPRSEVSRLLDFLRTRYDAVILDLPSFPTEFSVECARQADALLVIATCDLPSIYSTARHTAYLESCGVRSGSIRIVLNKFRPTFALESWNAVVGRPVFARLAEAGRILEEALMKGEPVADNSSFGVDVASIARQLTGLPLDRSNHQYALIQRCRALFGRLRKKFRIQRTLANSAKA